MRTNTAPWDYQRREGQTAEQLGKSITLIDTALTRYRASFVWTNLNSPNEDTKSICIICGKIIPQYEGWMWRMTDNRPDRFQYNDPSDRLVTLCQRHHGEMTFTPEELGKRNTIVMFHFGGNIARIGNRTYKGVTKTSQHRLHECSRSHAIDVSFHQGGWGFVVERECPV